MKTLNQKIKIQRIDHNKIQEGEVLFSGKIYDQKGNFIQEASYIEQEYPKLE